jgi:Putative restriction endonuclease
MSSTSPSRLARPGGHSVAHSIVTTLRPVRWSTRCPVMTDAPRAGRDVRTPDIRRASMSTTKPGLKPPTLEDLDALPPGVVGWWIVTEPGIELPDTPEISPDVAGWRCDRMPQMPLDEPIRLVPDWVCEILSPHTRRHDQLIKMPHYARVGVSAPGSSISRHAACSPTASRQAPGARSATTATSARLGSSSSTSSRSCLGLVAAVRAREPVVTTSLRHHARGR